jgi:hypothetical protein
VFAEHVSLAGRKSIVSATGITLAKRANVPVPRPLRTPPDPAGDGPDGPYAPSGLAGNTAAHKVRSDPLGTTDPARRMCLLPDAVAHLFNWENLHPFAYHEADWAVPEEGAAGAALTNQVAPAYGTLDTLDRLAAPSPVYLDVDHRYGLTAVYETESVFHMAEDGSIVIRDGWGSEIRMGGGQIELRAAGDVRVHAGRDAITWAGYDVVLRARKSVDLTAATGDVRTKAERNSHHLAGNSGYGGFHFESRATCPVHAYTGLTGSDVTSSGFVVRCPSATVDVQAADVRVALDPAAPADARITLDAGTSRSVYTRAKQTVHRVTANGAVVHLFDNGFGARTAANEFTVDHALLGTDVLVAGRTFVDDCLAVRGWVTSGVHFASATATALGGAVSQFTGSLVGAEGDVAARLGTLVGSFGAAFDAQTLPAPNVTAAEFTCRTAAQYGSTQFVYWRAHWEAVAAAAGQTLSTWTEPAVVGLVSGTTTYPHPGERWTAAGSYAYQTFTFVDGATGWVAVDRTSARAVYETGTPAAAGSGTLASLYTVTVGT